MKEQQITLDGLDTAQETTALINIVSLPEIQENLRALKERWEAKSAEAESLVCTEESVQSIKAARAEMRKEFEAADEQRKAVKAQYVAPWNAVEATWKACVADPFKRADEAYKTKLGAFEGEIKARCIEELKRYYAELQQTERLEWLPFERAMSFGGVKVNLSDAKTRSARKLKDALAEVTSRIALDVERIEKMHDAAAIMAEYKISLDVGAAVSAVQERKRREEAERDLAQRRQEEEARRAEAIAKVEAAAPVSVAPPEKKEPEKVFPRFTFTVLDCTRPQLIGIREYLKQEGIRYE